MTDAAQFNGVSVGCSFGRIRRGKVRNEQKQFVESGSKFAHLSFSGLNLLPESATKFDEALSFGAGLRDSSSVLV